MNDFFRRLPLMAKLLVIAVVPLFFIGYLTIDLYKEKSDNLALAKTYHARINQSINLTRLASELQKERRYSFVYALKKIVKKRCFPNGLSPIVSSTILKTSMTCL